MKHPSYLDFLSGNPLDYFLKMGAQQEGNNRLSSWKEIAAYLDCDVRTCRRWEMSKGLPVHRIGESEKARVFAFRHELDHWLKNQAQNNNHKHLSKKEKYSLRWYHSVAVFLILAGAAAAYFTISALSYNHVPFDFRIDRSQLIILNQEGRELWRYDTGLENLLREQSYRACWQYKRRFEGDRVEFPLLAIKDINQDGKVEVLFSIQTQNEINEGTLICFNHTGEEMWRFLGGRELTFGDKLYSQDYRIKGFMLYDLARDGNSEILVISVHKPDFPCQLAILDHNGKKQSEYWNAGYLMDIEFHDLDQNDNNEMIVAGMNNEYGRGCLMVFDPLDIQGFSPQTNPQYNCKELQPGSFTHYILFPRTDVRQEYPIDAIVSISLMNSGGLSLVTDLDHLIYELKPDLSIHRVSLTNTFKALHSEARLAGKIDSVLDEIYEKKLMEDLSYFDGEGWVSKPTRCQRQLD